MTLLPAYPNADFPLPGRRALLRAAGALVVAAAIPSARAAATDAVDKPLAKLYAALESVMRLGRATPFVQRFDLLAPVVDQVFDLETVLKLSVGSKWETMGPEAQAHLLKVYRRFTVATYVANFDTNDGEHFVIMPDVRESGADRIVATEIVGANGDKNRLDYLMRDEQGNWRAVDVLLDGSISRVAVQRSDFRKVLATGDADSLITTLRKKIVDLSDGALSS